VPGRRYAGKVMLRADAVWERLNRLNMSQNDLARLLGVSTGHLSRLINGRRCPSPKMRKLLMETLECSEFDDLFVVVSCHE
jgi:transcriptional regulator with XRE-family HTH domain